MLQPADLLQPGRFLLGCNYWASHAGTRMWADWRPEVVERDFRLLSEAGLETSDQLAKIRANVLKEAETDARLGLKIWQWAEDLGVDPIMTPTGRGKAPPSICPPASCTFSAMLGLGGASLGKSLFHQAAFSWNCRTMRSRCSVSSRVRTCRIRLRRVATSAASSAGGSISCRA